ncbi:protein FAR1-RELATED SEQUENCE 5-like [Magnolia sinica]|uniref:protein FAR1-RELATED SEQUENCE 5-like n=1 Tax=Magnolia sinica TaxID=86752 RepID=UPI002658EC42|nr:protein FAR1-RELATED SEQUENCE 5-like [Magnolia sinica]
MTILTDQDAAMANAIASVMPGTYHRLCIWHIYQNAAKHLSHVFKGSTSFEHDLNRCIYDYEYEEEFLTVWNNMILKYNLMDNKWLQNLFKEKEKWALVYGRNTFCADMKSTQRSESMNNLLKNYLNSKYDLLRFFTHYERTVASRRYKESMTDFKMRQSTLVMFLDVKILNETAKVYTPEVFEMFQEEYKKHLRYSISKCGEFSTIAEYCVYNDKDERRTVRFDSLDGTMTCSCKKFEFVGILCSHAMKVLDFYNIKEVDPRYIMKRWRRDAKEGFGRDHTRVPTKGEHNIVFGKRYKYLCSKLHRIIAMAEEHDELFKFADKYTDKFHDEMMERMKGMKEPPLRSCKSVDESIKIEHAHH